MTSAYIYKKNNLKIIVLDKFLNNEECDVIGSFIEGSEFTKTERDSAQTDHIRQWVLEKLPKEYIKYFEQKLTPIFKKHFPQQRKRLIRAYCNSISYGDMTFPHRDCDEDETDITVLIYINKTWNKNWGGETMFYDKDNILAAVLPVPGRAVIFHGAFEHKAGVPTRECYVARYTIALKCLQK